MSLDISRLENPVRQADDSIHCRCPVCARDNKDTKGDNLKIYPEGGYRCIVGCDNKEIFALAGLKDKEAKSKRPISNTTASNKSKLGPIVKEYSYRDAEGREVYQVCRYAEPKKDFRQRHKVDGEWVWKIKGITLVPYNLPELIKAQRVLIQEGEKDVDTLMSLGEGFTATCNAGGAGKWEASWAAYFTGKDVIICPDNDEPGRKHAQDVARKLGSAPRSIRLATIPGPAKDISDYLQNKSHEEALSGVEELIANAVDARAIKETVPVETEEQIQVGNYPANDFGNAQRFVDYAQNRVRYVPEWESWIIWDKHHWRPDDDGGLYRLAEEHAADVLRKAADCPDMDQRTREAKLALSLGKRGTIENMLALARYHQEVIQHAESLDANPWIVGVKNGVVNLRDGSFRNGKPDDLISNRIGCDYIPNAKCDRFEEFLDRIMGGDSDMINYIWRIIGYSLTGSTKEQCLFFFYGSGRNGKSTLIEVLAALMGDYGRATAVELIIDEKGREPSQLIAALKGRRLVWLPEVEESHRIAQSRLKTLSGGDRLCGRNLYEREFEFNSTAKLLIHGNTRPEIRGTDLGIWRRFRLIPFSVTIPAGEVDHDLARKLIEELPGILNRALESCLEWLQFGLMTPKLVESATAEYREAEDILAEFLEECTIRSTMAEVTKGALYKAYTGWAEERHQRPLSAKRFGSLLLARGIKEHRSKSVKMWLELAIR